MSSQVNEIKKDRSGLMGAIKGDLVSAGNVLVESIKINV